MPSPSGGASIPARTFPAGRSSPSHGPPPGAQKAAGRRDKTIYCRYRADRGRRTLRGIDEQVAKAEKAVAGLIPVKRNRFITLAEGENSVNRALEAKARALAGLKGYTTNLAACPDGTPVTAEFVRSLLDQAVATYTEGGGYDPALLAQARTVFEQVALADDFPTFLTLPAYELLP